MKKIFALVTAGALALSLSACQASSQQTTDTTTKSADSTDTAAAKNDGSFPSETITLVCPFSAGGGTDIGARNLAQALSKVMGVNVVVENQTGSGGWVAWTDLIQGDYKDGYTIGLINHNYAMGELDPDNPRNIISMTSLSLQTRLSTTMSWRSVLMTHGSPILTALSSTPNPILFSFPPRQQELPTETQQLLNGSTRPSEPRSPLFR